MARLIAHCGLACDECPAYKATITKDDKLRAETAEKWSAAFGFAFTPEMINCTGCREPGAKIGHCAECKIRACSSGKGFVNCGKCPDFATCDTIQSFLKEAPEARANLVV